MRAFSWTLRYFSQLAGHSLALWVVLGVQWFIVFSSAHSASILNNLATEATAWQLFFTGAAGWLYGLFLMAGAYWLLFFSNTSGPLYLEPEAYPQSSFKIRAWQYHSHIAENARWFTEIYTGFLLWMPWLLLMVATFCYELHTGFWYMLLAGLGVANGMVLVLRKTRRGFPLQIVRSFCLAAHGVVQKTTDWFWQMIGFILPKEKKLPAGSSYSFLPMVTTERALALAQARPALLGSWYLLMATGLFCLLGVQADGYAWVQALGTAAVVPLVFSGWISVAMGLSILNKKYAFPFRALLLALLAGAVYHHYHTKETVFQGMKAEKAPASSALPYEPLPEHFLYSQVDSTSFIPFIIFIAHGEGSAFAYQTALFLEAFQEKYENQLHGSTYAMAWQPGANMGMIGWHTVRKYYPEAVAKEKIRAFCQTDFEAPTVYSSLTSGMYRAMFPWVAGSSNNQTLDALVHKALHAHLVPKDSALPSLTSLHIYKGISANSFFWFGHTLPDVVAPVARKNMASSQPPGIEMITGGNGKAGFTTDHTYAMVLSWLQNLPCNPAGSPPVIPLVIDLNASVSRPDNALRSLIQDKVKSLHPAGQFVSLRFKNYGPARFLPELAAKSIETEVKKHLASLPSAWVFLSSTPKTKAGIKVEADSTISAPSQTKQVDSIKRLPPSKKTGLTPSPKRTPWLYYYSVKRKKWVLKSASDFKLSGLKPLRKKSLPKRTER